jgi:hypothetical protein
VIGGPVYRMMTEQFYYPKSVGDAIHNFNASHQTQENHAVDSEYEGSEYEAKVKAVKSKVREFFASNHPGSI